MAIVYSPLRVKKETAERITLFKTTVEQDVSKLIGKEWRTTYDGAVRMIIDKRYNPTVFQIPLDRVFELGRIEKKKK